MAISSFTWYCGAELPGEVMAAAFEAYHFEPHFHDAWSVGVIAEGSCSFSCGGRQYVARQGELVVIPPRAVHTGGTSEGLLSYAMAYLQTGWVEAHAAMLHGGRPAFSGVVIADRALCERWLAALTGEALADADRKGAISAALLELLARHAVPAAEPAPADGGADACAELRAAMSGADAPKADVGMLARRWGVHRTTLSKRFARRYGLPPDAWLRNWRAAKAKTLVTDGMALAEVAAATGFADQAHLTRVFKRIHGAPPGALRKPPVR